MQWQNKMNAAEPQRFNLSDLIEFLFCLKIDYMLIKFQKYWKWKIYLKKHRKLQGCTVWYSFIK